MTIRKVTVKDALKSHFLAAAVLRQLGGGADAVQSAIEAGEHGADAGWSGFTYYSDTIAFAIRHRKALADAVKYMANDLGEEPIAMVRGFNCFRNDKPSEEAVAKALYGDLHARHGNIDDEVGSVLNALAWFALEEVGRAIADFQCR